jgi:hypothetical protein
MDGDARSFGRECTRACRADAAGRAGDEHALAREAGVHEGKRMLFAWPSWLGSWSPVLVALGLRVATAR